MTARAMRSPAEVSAGLWSLELQDTSWTDRQIERARRLYLHWWRLALLEEARTKETACLLGRVPKGGA